MRSLSRGLPCPGLRWGTVWLAPGQVAGGLARTGLEKKIKHARVRAPGSQDRDRVSSSGLTQYPLQLGDGPRVMAAALGAAWSALG
jgi:hypothetical protein